MGNALCKIVLTSGATTKTYGVDTANRLLDVKHQESPYSQTATVIVDNADGTLTTLDLQGYSGIISYGYNTSAGDEYSPTAYMYVVSQGLKSWQGGMVCILTLKGFFDFMGDEVATPEYTPLISNTDTVKTILTAIANKTLVSYGHCINYAITFDSEDALIDSYAPADTFRVAYNEPRLSAFKKLMELVGCVARFEDDGGIHIFVPKMTEDSGTWASQATYSLRDIVEPTTPTGYYYICTTAGNAGVLEPTWTTDVGDTIADDSGGGTVVWTVAYDYEYKLTTGYHTFFQKELRERLVIPNSVLVISHPDAMPNIYTGSASSAASYALVPINRFYRLRPADNTEATNIAKALIKKAELDAVKGAGHVPMNVGQEVHDFVVITDSRENDYAAGNIKYLNRSYEPGKFEMWFSLGSEGVGSERFLSLLSQGQMSFSEVVQQVTENLKYIDLAIKELVEHNDRLAALEGTLDKPLIIPRLHVTHQLIIPVET